MIWLFGRPGAGKTTLAYEVASLMNNSRVLDGDYLRKTISKDLGFTLKDRFEHVKRTLKKAKSEESLGYFPIIALITPIEQYRSYIKEKHKTCHLIYIKCDLDTCKQRDPKGLYKNALSHKIKDFTGVTHPFEEPKSPDFIIDTRVQSIEQSGECLFNFYRKTYLMR